MGVEEFKEKVLDIRDNTDNGFARFYEEKARSGVKFKFYNFYTEGAQQRMFDDLWRAFEDGIKDKRVILTEVNTVRGTIKSSAHVRSITIRYCED